ncbi:MAG: hypothetical protein R3F18_12500 [Lysobacterales bacterium]|nr:hypothetical protein [Xanthomonadales bacterium]MCB1610204.1 hypothetical protein [Xanthomonadales bacterium]MCP5476190.1 hypothetical protein [Rhodanobacteraceae bacterium]
MQVDVASALLDLDSQFPADACEHRVRDVAQAAEALRERRPDLFAVMQEVGQSYLSTFGEEWRPLLKKAQDALALSFVRMASRHGSWGRDLHEYHNEQHALELLNGRLARARLQLGWQALGAQDWLLLALFATCHDLRQREAADFWHDIGANERASIAEACRILDQVGFSREQDREFFVALSLMIAGSTFDARPAARNFFNTAEVASSGGSLAPKLVAELRAERAEEDLDPETARYTRLMLFAADLDTANVAEPFAAFAGSAVRLVQEREKRAGRALNAAESALPVFDFLTSGQERYFFELHRFVSPLGLEVFGNGKRSNEPKVQWQSRRMRELFSGGPRPGQTGQHVIEAFLRLADEIG